VIVLVPSGTPRAPGTKRPGRAARAFSASASRDTSSRAGGLAEIMVALGLVALVFAQASGRIVIDSKFDLVEDPARFLAYATHLWDARSTFGQIQNQAYGYLFPMGAFYLLGHALAVPMWVVQRAWFALLLVVAYAGVLALGKELGIGTRATRILAGFAYAASPFSLTVAIASAGMPPAAMLPWCLLPLVRVARGAIPPAKGAALSGLAVLAMGGVNATATYSVLVMPLVWIATRRSDEARARTLGWWLLAVGLATAWFVMALWFQTRYGLDFLRYTETPRDTTEWTSIPEVLRGGGLWMSLIAIHGIWTPAGWLYETAWGLVLATSFVAALGLYGLARRDMPERLFFGLALLLGALAMSVGYWGHFGSPLASVVHSVLNGPLGPFRNVNKFQPVVLLALALGLAHGLASAPLGAARKARRARSRAARIWHLLGGGARPLRAAGWAAAALVVGLASLPLFVGRVYPEGSFPGLPGYWIQAIDWLDAHGGHDTTLVIPGVEFARFVWGTPNDQPLEGLARVPWAVRNIIPLGSVGNTMVMDAIDQALVAGEPSPGLAAFLARAGVRYLLVENDLDPLRVSSPPPTVIRMILASTPGFAHVASFGPLVADPDAGPSAGIDYDPEGLTRGIRALEIWQVETPVAPVVTYPANEGVVVSGGPQALLAAANAGALPDLAATLAGDPHGPRFAQAAWIDADTQQLRDTDFGQLYNQYSYVLAPGALAPTAAGTIGGTIPSPPKQWAVVPGEQHDATAVLRGAASITSSSYGTPIARIPGYQPLAAFVANPGDGAWAASGTDPRPWIRIAFVRPIELRTITVEPLDDGPWRPLVTQIAVTTARGTVRSDLLPQAIPQQVRVVPGMSRFLRIEITRTLPPAEPNSPAGPGIARILIPGVRVTEAIALPDDVPATSPAAPRASYLMAAPLPNPFEYLSPPDDEPHLRRIFHMAAPETFHVVATATPRPGPLLLEATTTPSKLSVTASSTFANLPVFRPQNLVDHDPLTSWWASAGDEHPTVAFSWPGLRVLSSVDILIDPAASEPEEILLDTGTATRLLKIPSHDLPPFGSPVAPTTIHLTFAPLVTDHVLVSFPKVRELPTLDLVTGRVVPTPVGLSELDFPALADLTPPPPQMGAPVDLPCGQGPPIRIDGTTYETSLRTTMQGLFSLTPVPLTLCGPTPNRLALGAGTHELVAEDEGSMFKVTSVDLIGSLPPRGASRAVAIDAWGDESRTVTVGPGKAAILDVRQNYNRGWAAFVDGRRLQAVRVDGWQQGFELPASNAPLTVELVFEPATPFRAALLLGLVLACVLVAWACWPAYRRRRRRPPGPGRAMWASMRMALRRTRRVRAAPPVGADGYDGVPRMGAWPWHGHSRSLSMGAPMSPSPAASPWADPTNGTAPAPRGSDRSPRTSWLSHLRSTRMLGTTLEELVAGAALTVALVFLAGPLAAAVPLLLALQRARRTVRVPVLGSPHTLELTRHLVRLPLPFVAAGAMALAGIDIALRPGTQWTAWAGSLSYVAQAFGAIALAALLIALRDGARQA
jgi:arabinofuranan 3-O-arabinosyltransferase